MYTNVLKINATIGELGLQANISFANDFILVTGKNGAGKTSLLRCLAGLEYVQGQVLINQQLWLDSNANFVLPTTQRHLACLWTEPALLPWLNVAQNITLGTAHSNTDANNTDANNTETLLQLAAQLEISLLMQRKPYMLSTGEAQRVALARAMYSRQTALMLLDEPFSAQAPSIRSHLRNVLQAWQATRQIPVIMVSHDATDAKILAHQHWHMRTGNLITAIEPLEKIKIKMNIKDNH